MKYGNKRRLHPKRINQNSTSQNEVISDAAGAPPACDSYEQRYRIEYLYPTEKFRTPNRLFTIAKKKIITFNFAYLDSTLITVIRIIRWLKIKETTWHVNKNVTLKLLLFFANLIKSFLIHLAANLFSNKLLSFLPLFF